MASADDDLRGWVNKISVLVPVNGGSQEHFGARVTLHALKENTTIAQILPANQSSEPQIVF